MQISNTVLPGPLRALAAPLTLPYDLTKALYYLAKKDTSDQRSIDSAKAIFDAVAPRLQQSVNSMASELTSSSSSSRSSSSSSSSNGNSGGDTDLVSRARDAVGALQRARIQERLPTVGRLGRQLASSVLNRAASRLEARGHDLENHGGRKSSENGGLAVRGGEEGKEQREQPGFTRNIARTSSSVARSLASAIGGTAADEDTVIVGVAGAAE